MWDRAALAAHRRPLMLGAAVTLGSDGGRRFVTAELQQQRRYGR